MELSRRQLEALGEPLGDLTQRKERGYVCRGGGKGSKPPNYEPIAQAYREMASVYQNIANTQFAMSERRYQESKPTADRIAALQIEGQELANRQAQDYYDYSLRTFRPAEEEFARRAMEFNTEENRRQLAARASTDVEQQMALQRGSAMRALSRMGVNPNSGRMMELLGETGLRAAAMRANAANQATLQSKAMGMNMLAGVSQLGRNMPATSLQAIGTGVGAGTAAGGAMGIADRIGQSYSSLGMNALGGQMGAIGGQMNAMNTQYQNQLAYDQQQGSSMAGIGQLIGMGASMIPFSSEKVKDGKKPIKEGKALRALENMPVEEWEYKPGIEDGGSGRRHVSPYAEDFQRETGLGDGVRIDVRDQLGVTMRAVQDLAEEVRALKGRGKPKKMANGGYVRGPGTGTSDSVKAVNVDTGDQILLSNGEYVLSADVVRKIGKSKLDALQKALHKPVRG